MQRNNNSKVIIKLNFRNQKQNIYNTILRLLENEAIEDSCLIFTGNLLIYYFPSIESNINLRIIELSLKKLYHTELPALIKSLILMFSRFILFDQDSLLRILNNINYENKNALIILLEKWLSYIDHFEEKNLRKFVFIALAGLLKNNNNKFFDNPYLSQISEEEIFDGNVYLKILFCLIYILNRELDESRNHQEILLKNDLVENTNNGENSEALDNSLEDNDYDDLNIIENNNVDLNLKVINEYK